MLSKPNRLKKRTDFRKVFSRGKKISEGALVFRWVPSALTQSRFGFVVSKKVSKKAVVRNQIRRRLQEAARRISPFLEKKIDAIIIVSAGSEIKKKGSIACSLENIFAKAGLLKRK